MSEVVAGLGAAASRHRRMGAAVSGLDARIMAVKRQREGLKGAPLLANDRELRDLEDQRVTAGDLLSEAETQYADKRNAYDAALSAATKNVGRVGQACTSAAQRFDLALRDALAALDDIEREALPLANTVLPNPLAQYLHPRVINAAVAKAFEPRLGKSAAFAVQRSMAESIGEMVSDAREGAAQVRKKAAA